MENRPRTISQRFLSAGSPVTRGAACIALASLPPVSATAMGAGVAPEAVIQAAEKAMPIDGNHAHAVLGCLSPETDALLLVENPSRLIQDARAFWEERRLGEHELLMEAIQESDLPGAMMMLDGLAAAAGVDRWSFVESLLGTSMTIGMTLPSGDPGMPQTSEPTFVAVARTADADQLSASLLSVRRASGISRGQRDDPHRVREVGGVKCYIIDANVMFAQAGDRLIVASSLDAMTRAIARSEDPAPQATHLGADLLGNATRNTIASVGLSDRLASVIRAERPIQTSFDEPFAGILFGGLARFLDAADDGHAWLDTLSDGLELRTVLRDHTQSDETLPFEDQLGFFPALSRGVAWPALDADDLFGELRISRDWGRMIQHREEWLGVEGSNGLLEFFNGLTALAGGFDVLEEVFARIDGPVRIIATTDEMTKRPVTATPNLPGMLLELPVPDDAGLMASRLQSAALGAFGVFNIEAHQTGRTPRVIASEMHGEHQIVAATRHVDAGAISEGAADNFEPAVSYVDQRLWIGSSTRVLHGGLDRLEDDAGAADNDAPTPHDVIMIDGPGLARTLAANTDALIAREVIENNRTPADARAATEQLIELARWLHSATWTSRLDVDSDDPTLSLTLSVRLLPADEARAKP